MRHHSQLELPNAAAIPPSFELFYLTTVIRTLGATLQVTSERDIALRATQHTYAVMLGRWSDWRSRPVSDNARFAVALAIRTVTAFFRHLDMVTPPEQQRGTEHKHWFDVREGLRELSGIVHSPLSAAAEPTLTALVVSHDPLLRRTMTERLTQLGAVTFHQAATAAEARNLALLNDPCQLTVVDLELSDGRGLELITYLHRSGYRWIVALAPPADPSVVSKAFQAGAQGCLLRTTTPANDERPHVTQHGTTSTPILTHPYRLSTREIEVLQLVAAGHSNKEIGQELELSALTVRSHLSRIGRKMNTGDRAQMVALAMRAGIIH